MGSVSPGGESVTTQVEARSYSLRRGLARDQIGVPGR